MPCRLFSRIHAAVLAARATKTDLQAAEPTFDIIRYRDINQVKHTVQKNWHIGLLFQIIDHRFVFAGEGFVLIDASGVQDAATIEHKTAAIAAIIGWYAMLFITETGNFYRLKILINRQTVRSPPSRRCGVS